MGGEEEEEEEEEGVQGSGGKGRGGKGVWVEKMGAVWDEEKRMKGRDKRECDEDEEGEGG